MHINYLDKNNETRHINMDTCIGRMAQHEKILHGEPMMDICKCSYKHLIYKYNTLQHVMNSGPKIKYKHVN